MSAYNFNINQNFNISQHDPTKIIQANKIKICGNCGKKGHLYKYCHEPITSIGIIGIKLDINNNSLKTLITDLKTTTNIDIESCIGISGDVQEANNYRNKLKFSLISRKHSVAFIEFVRGRYEIDNFGGIIYIFRQMLESEFLKIKNAKDFSDLWNDLWIHTSDHPKHHEEFKKSKEKFDKLKNGNDGALLKLDFYLTNTTPTWKSPEWGFPKGRKNINETNIECGRREFMEETGLLENDFIVLDNVKPFEEEFIGTNGINYKHIYYIGIITTNKNLLVDDKNTHQIEEIGDIGYFSYDESVTLIRSDKAERKKILTFIYMYFINLLIKKKLN